MASKKIKGENLPAVVPADAKGADVGAFALTDQVRGFALTVGVDLSGSRDERANLAAEHMNRSQRHMLASGLLLASLKAECEHGEFTELVEARGFEMRAAQKAMQYAEFIAAQPEANRLRLIELPRSRVMEIAGADPEVIESLLSAEGENQIELLSVRKLRERVQELEASTTDLQVQRDTAESEVEGLKRKLKRGLPERADQVPHDVADLRAEIMALGRKAELALDSFSPMASELIIMANSASADWADATVRLAVAQLAAVRIQVEGVLARFIKLLPGEDPAPAPRSKLTKQEVAEAARMFSELAQTHTYEAALREWQREQERPKGKGRPKDKPVAPGGAQ